MALPDVAEQLKTRMFDDTLDWPVRDSAAEDLVRHYEKIKDENGLRRIMDWAGMESRVSPRCLAEQCLVGLLIKRDAIKELVDLSLATHRGSATSGMYAARGAIIVAGQLASSLTTVNRLIELERLLMHEYPEIRDLALEAIEGIGSNSIHGKVNDLSLRIVATANAVAVRQKEDVVDLAADVFQLPPGARVKSPILLGLSNEIEGVFERIKPPMRPKQRV